MKLAPSVQRKLMFLTPMPVFEMLCRAYPKFAIELLCHWLNEKNINVEERFLAPRLIAPVPVAKKVSQLSVLSILNLLRQDDKLWKFYVPNHDEGAIINLNVLPYILLELIFDLGGKEGREKVAKVVEKCRTTIGAPKFEPPKQGEPPKPKPPKQIDLLKNFKTDTVLDIFEMLPPTEVGMILKHPACEIEMAAFWLTHWDMRMERMDQPPKSEFWLGQIPGDRAFKIEKAMRELEFRHKFIPAGEIYEYKNEWNEWRNV